MYVCIRFVIFLITCKNASVLIDGSVMRKACGDEKTAKWLEENLAIMPDVIRNAQKAAISHGSKLISVEFKFTNNGTEMTTCGILERLVRIQKLTNGWRE